MNKNIKQGSIMVADWNEDNVKQGSINEHWNEYNVKQGSMDQIEMNKILKKEV